MEGYRYNDGGRASFGFKGETGDCVCRAIAIASGISYAVVYEAIGEVARELGLSKSVRRTGVPRKVTDKLLPQWGWRWVPTMKIGSGCKVHLRPEELPTGNLIVKCSRHMVAVIDGVVHDTNDPRRNGTRCVYGYWTQANETED